MTEYVKVDTEEFTALYQDGILVTWTDSYLIDEYLFYTVLGGKLEENNIYYEMTSRDDNFEMPRTLEEYRHLLDEPVEVELLGPCPAISPSQQNCIGRAEWHEIHADKYGSTWRDMMGKKKGVQHD